MFPELTAANTYGFNTPDLRAIRELLVGEYRGLLPWSPVLVMAVPGVAVLFRKERALAAAIVAEIIAVRRGRRGGFLKERLGPIHEREPAARARA